MSYPFVKCYKPIHIYKNGKKLLVPCGKCNYCITSKASYKALLCSAEEEKYKFCVFLTLTYSNEYVPKFYLKYNEEEKCYDFLCATSRIAPLGTLLSWHPLPFYDKNKISSLAYKCNLGGYFTFLYKKDIQDFLKRLRKRIKNERLRYYFVGEYGPVHYRAHYHALLYFNELETLNRLPSYIRSSWQYGRIDFSLSRGSAASYCASYVNSLVHLPALFKIKPFEPFQTHSTCFASEIREEIFQKIYVSSASEIAGMCKKVGDFFVQSTAFRSFKTSYLPKCRDFSNCSFGLLLRSYTSFNVARSYFHELGDNVFQIALAVYMAKDFGLNKHLFFNLTFEQLLSDLYLSKRFLTTCCANNRQPFVYIKRIVEFYKFIDYENLKEFYHLQETFFSKNDLSALPLFYNETFDLSLLSSRSDYKSFIASSEIKLQSKIKHKKINDLNKIYE